MSLLVLLVLMLVPHRVEASWLPVCCPPHRCRVPRTSSLTLCADKGELRVQSFSPLNTPKRRRVTVSFETRLAQLSELVAHQGHALVPVREIAAHYAALLPG